MAFVIGEGLKMVLIYILAFFFVLGIISVILSVVWLAVVGIAKAIQQFVFFVVRILGEAVKQMLQAVSYIFRLCFFLLSIPFVIVFLPFVLSSNLLKRLFLAYAINKSIKLYFSGGMLGFYELCCKIENLVFELASYHNPFKKVWCCFFEISLFQRFDVLRREYPLAFLVCALRHRLLYDQKRYFSRDYELSSDFMTDLSKLLGEELYDSKGQKSEFLKHIRCLFFYQKESLAVINGVAVSLNIRSLFYQQKYSEVIEFAEANSSRLTPHEFRYLSASLFLTGESDKLASLNKIREDELETSRFICALLNDDLNLFNSLSREKLLANPHACYLLEVLSVPYYSNSLKHPLENIGIFSAHRVQKLEQIPSLSKPILVTSTLSAGQAQEQTFFSESKCQTVVLIQPDFDEIEDCISDLKHKLPHSFHHFIFDETYFKGRPPEEHSYSIEHVEKMHADYSSLMRVLFKEACAKFKKLSLSELFFQKVILGDEDFTSSINELVAASSEAKMAHNYDRPSWFLRYAEEVEKGNDQAILWNRSMELRKGAARLGSSESSYFVGKSYERGIGVDIDFDKAIEWYSKASQLNHVEAAQAIKALSFEKASIDQCSSEDIILLKKAINGDANAQYEYALTIKDSDPSRAFEYYTRSAERGYVQAQKAIAECYEKGIGCEQDEDKAFAVFFKLAQKGDSYSQYKTATFYIEGKGTDHSSYQAVGWLEKSVSQNNCDAKMLLAKCYEEGDGVSKNIERAITIYKECSLSGYRVADFCLGCIYLDSSSECFDLEEAHLYLDKAAQGDHYQAKRLLEEHEILSLFIKAKNGNSTSQRLLGDRFLKGEGVKQDYKESYKWHEKSALQGDSTAQDIMGDYFWEGIGVPVDYSKGFIWHKKSAENNNPRGLQSFGHYYYLGKHVGQDLKEAFNLYRRSADGGDSDGQCSVAQCYLLGQGVASNYNDAFFWFTQSAKQDHRVAQLCLAQCYIEGYGVSVDYNKAFFWSKKSAEAGCVDAQYVLGAQYYSGNGVTKDTEQAYFWLKKAAEQGHTKAQEALRNSF